MQSLDTRELPNSPAAEATVLGAILIDKTGDAAEIASSLEPETFFNPAHRQIFKAMLNLHRTDDPIELPALVNELNGMKQLEKIGGVSYLAKLAHAVPTAANVGYYIGLLEDKHTLRKAIYAAERQMLKAYESDDAGLVVNSMLNEAAALSDQASSDDDFQPIKEVLFKVIESTEERCENVKNGITTGLYTGYTDLDGMLAGLHKGDLIIVAARPSVGKTAFALNIAQNVAVKTKETVAVFSLEMSAPQLVQRMVSAEVNLDANTMRTGEMKAHDWDKMAGAASILGEANIFIADPGVITVQEIRTRCRRLKKSQGLGLIVIDYLQLIQGRGKGGENRQQEVSEISRTLKQIARELDVPVIALSQLSRAVEQRQDKRPMMSDLRESGAIEQDADVVAFLYRDDYYNQDSEKKNIIEIIIAKQRNGSVGTVELIFLKQFNKFVNYERVHAS
ncbi:replicative DNA helicase [Paenibacillus sp. PastF-3]|uniref:replicative DNA helicase n=1 Tax=Paenibacillus sp. PastF-3 TaxID=2940626 RepID=UPI0024758C44|nr:replicative DNA helicase [Paenibacillus sp. PastF-3]MDH6370573.1 replicative DNA helicase [Paenibacillus sp. PastF-3]